MSFLPLQLHLRLDGLPKSPKIFANFLANSQFCYCKYKEYQRKVCDYRSFLHFLCEGHSSYTLISSSELHTATAHRFCPATISFNLLTP